MESDLTRVRDVARELLRKVERGGSNGADAAELERLRQQCVRQEANLKAASWTISALESETKAPEASADVAKLEAALVAAQQKIEELSRARS